MWHSAASPQMWGRLVTCGRLSIGLPKLSRNRQQADLQSAAGCHPAYKQRYGIGWKKSSRAAKILMFSNADDRSLWSAFCAGLGRAHIFAAVTVHSLESAHFSHHGCSSNF